MKHDDSHPQKAWHRVLYGDQEYEPVIIVGKISHDRVLVRHDRPNEQ